MRPIRFVPVCAFLSLSSLCLAQSPAARNAAKAGACGPDNDRFSAHRVRDTGTPAAPPAGKALVYVVETQDPQGVLCVQCSITPQRSAWDGAWVGATYGDSFVAFPVDAGEHHLCTAWQSVLPPLARQTSLSGFTAEPGKVYYFRTRVTVPREELPAQFSLEPVGQDEGKLLLASAKRSEARKN